MKYMGSKAKYAEEILEKKDFNAKNMNLPLNTIINGDCLEVMKGIESKSIDCVATDPPYGMNFQSGHRKIQYDKIENDNNLNWLPSFVQELKRITKEEAHIYIFCSFHNIDIFKQEIEKFFKLKNILFLESKGAIRNGEDGTITVINTEAYEKFSSLVEEVYKFWGRKDYAIKQGLASAVERGAL